MSNNNYHKPNNYKKPENVNVEVTETPVIEKPVVEEVVEETMVEEAAVEEPAVEETVEAVIAGCELLNLRKEPNTDCEILAVLNAGCKLLVNKKESNDEWTKVCTIAGIEGYCMTKFVSANK